MLGSIKSFDFIVLGAGTAGLAAVRGLANRFPDSRIALIEQGEAPSQKENRFSTLLQRVPLLQPLLLRKAAAPSLPLGGHHSSAVQRHVSTPQRHAAGRRVALWSGCGVGGTTQVSDLKGVRPSAGECDAWGSALWGWDAFSPFLRETLPCTGDSPLPESVPIQLAALRHATRSVVDAPLNIRFYEACEAAGLPPTASFNQGGAEGYSFYESLVSLPRRERVILSLDSCVADAAGGRGVRLFTSTRAEEILVDGSKVSGVRCRHTRDHDAVELKGGQVILALGAVETPALLLRSGIGGALGRVLANEAVGANLIAPTAIGVQMRMMTDPSTNAMTLKGLHPRNARYLWQQWREYTEQGTGVFSALCEAGVFLRSSPAVSEPDLSIDFYRHPLFTPLDDGHHISSLLSTWRQRLQPLGFSFQAVHHHPRSRGRVAWDEAAQRTLVEWNLLSDAEGHDLRTMDEGLQWIARLSDPKLPSAYYSNEKHEPAGPFYHLKVRMTHPSKNLSTEQEVHQFIQQQVVLHGCGNVFGTCAMGAVVDEQLRVLGLEGLRVADCSVVPKPTVATSWVVSAGIGGRVHTFY